MYSNSSLYVSFPLIQIGDQEFSDVSEEFLNDVLQVSVEESLSLPSTFSIVINNSYFSGDRETEPWQHDQYVQIGKKVRIGFQSASSQAPEFDESQIGYIIEGEVTAIETHFTSRSQSPVIMRGYDISHRLHRGRFNRSFQNYTDSDIVQAIAREVDIPLGTLDPSNLVHDYVFQANQTNMEFLRERAARIGFELFVQDGKLFFRQPVQGEQLQLQWLRDLESFRVRMTTAEQVSAVEVRGWDYGQKQPIVGTAQTKSVMTQTRIDPDEGTTFGHYTTQPKLIVVDQPVSSTPEATTLAQSILNEVGGELLQADASTPGDPRIRVGKVVSLEQMGRYSGQYYVTEARHVFYEGIYRTEFSVRGLRGGSLLRTISPTTHLKPGQTMLVGIVTDNQDPQGWGRVRVKFPTLTPEEDGGAHASQWARVVGAGAGSYRGLCCLPEINDEVLVAFEHGDIHRPYVIGGVWNGQDPPPTAIADTVSGGKVRLKTWQSRVNHRLQFVEEDKDGSKTGIYFKTQAGHEIRLNDSDRSLEIVTVGNQRIRLSDQTNQIEIATPGGHRCILDDANRTLTLHAAGGLNLSAEGDIRIQSASGEVVINARMIRLN